MDPFITFLNDLAGDVPEEKFMEMIYNYLTEGLAPSITVRDRENIIKQPYQRVIGLFDKLRSTGHLTGRKSDVLINLLKRTRQEQLAMLVQIRFDKGFSNDYPYTELKKEAANKFENKASSSTSGVTPCEQSGSTLPKQQHADHSEQEKVQNKPTDETSAREQQGNVVSGDCVDAGNSGIHQRKHTKNDEEGNGNEGNQRHVKTDVVRTNGLCLLQGCKIIGLVSIIMIPVVFGIYYWDSPVTTSGEYTMPTVPVPSVINFGKARSVLILNDEWGTSKGGISSFHRQISQLARKSGCQVYVTALEASPEDIADAKNKGIHLIVAENTDKEKPSLNWLTKYHKIHFPNLEKEIPNLDTIIAHIPLTAEAAFSIRNTRFTGRKVFLFTHVIPEDTEVHKETGTPSKIENKEKAILKYAKDADAVFSVGPRIFNHFDNKFRALPKLNHKIFLPLPDEEFFDVSIRKPTGKQKIEVLTVGRVSGVENLKGYDIVAKAMSAVAEMFHQMNMQLPTWKIRGVPSDRHKESKEYIYGNLKSKYLQPNLYPYGDQKDIMVDLQQSHLFLMPSRSEPFGLVGLEALAAGLPVLVTKNSGLADFIKEYFPRDANSMIVDVGVTDTFLEEDVQIWHKSITDVLRDNYSMRFDVALDIKKKLKDLPAVKESEKVFTDLLLK